VSPWNRPGSRGPDAVSQRAIALFALRWISAAVLIALLIAALVGLV
jgi:hypothetical protein